MLARATIKYLANLVPIPATMLDYVGFRLFGAWRSKSAPTDQKALLETIERDGFAIVPEYWTRERCRQAIDEFEGLLVSHPQHVGHYSDLRIFGAEVLSPTINLFHQDQFLQSLSDAYTGAPTVNVFTLANKVEATRASKGSGEGWHKDSSFRQFKSFLYLDDVTEENGPLELLAGSHRIENYLRDMRKGRMRFRHLRISDEQLAAMAATNGARRKAMTGPAGTLIIADTACVHRGRPPVTGTRYALTNYYVEPDEISDDYIAAYKPVDPAKVLGLKPSATR